MCDGIRSLEDKNKYVGVALSFVPHPKCIGKLKKVRSLKSGQ